MSSARELALLEKWTDAAPPLSPTSPKATKFCCCPQRRRYNVKQPKKSTLHARNIFLDNDFSYIDDVAGDGNLSGNKSSTNNRCQRGEPTANHRPERGVTSRGAGGAFDKRAGIAVADDEDEAANLATLLSYRENCNHYDDIAELAASNASPAAVRKGDPVWRHDRSDKSDCHNISNNTTNNNNSICRSEYDCACQSNEHCGACPLQQSGTSSVSSNNHNTSNEHINNNNNNNNNSNRSVTADTTPKMTITTTNVANRKRSDCGLPLTAATAEGEGEATTSAPTLPKSAARASTATPALTATKPTGTTTTVIKTVAVKRSVVNEPTTAATATKTTNASPTTCKTSAATVTATATAAAGVSNVANHKKALEDALQGGNANTSNRESINKCDGFSDSTRSVKERIAALTAGNEQTKDHDNNNSNNSKTKTKAQCNKLSNNNMTKPAQSAINSLHHNQAAASGSHPLTTASPTKPTKPATAAPAPSISADANSVVATSWAEGTSTDDSPHQKSGLADMPHTTTTTTTQTPPATAERGVGAAVTSSTSPATAIFVGSTGCATMPRRRNPTLITNERCYSGSANNSSHHTSGSNGGSQMGDTTPNGKFCAGDKEANAAETSRDLAALDNLDLALNLNLTEEDGEDPYFALQEYLERVKHEINEVFELHKARQKTQQHLQEQETPAASAVATKTSEVTSDELSRSTESDSGFDSASASGVHIGGNGCSHKSPMRTATPAPAPAAAAANSSCANDASDMLQRHASPCDRRVAASSAKLEAARPPTTTKLKALPPPPLSPPLHESVASEQNNSYKRSLKGTSTSSTALATDAAAEAAADDVNIWANKFLRDLDNLMGADKLACSSTSSSPVSTTAPMLLSAAATAAIQSRYGKSAAERCDQHQQQQQQQSLVLRPEKHATIPLQSFNLDCGGRDSSNTNSAAASLVAPKSHVAYMRTLSAPAPYQQQAQQMQQQQQNDNKTACTAGGSGKSHRNSLAAFSVAELDQPHQQQQQQHNRASIQSNDAAATTILKIEETAVAATAAPSAPAAPRATTDAQAADEQSAKNKRQRQLDNDMETIRNAILAQRQQLAATMDGKNNMARSSDKNMLATGVPKRERINHAMTTTTTTATAITTKPTAMPFSTLLTPPTSQSSSSSASASPSPSSAALSTKSNIVAAAANASGTPLASAAAAKSANNYLLNGNDATKKGSTSTIWTSEESILRSVGAVDEDNNSTSSSACEEASGVLSSGKSGISLDSSGLDNDNNESGIGTATPPKELFYWKNLHNDSESVSSLDALRKMKFQKSSSVASSDDPDLLEVLSLYDEPHGDEEVAEDVPHESHGDNAERPLVRQQGAHKQQQQLAQAEPRQPQSRKQKQTRQLSCHHNHHHHHQHQHQLHHRQRRHNDNADSNEALVIEAEDVEAGVDVDADDNVLAIADSAAEAVDDEYDEGQDEFESVPYCDCEYTDGDVSSASGSGTSSSRTGGPTLLNHTPTAANSGVVLRRKCSATPIMVPFGGGGRAQKSRSHSLDTSSLPAAYPHYPNQSHYAHAQLSRKLHHLQQHQRTKERSQLALALRQEPFQSLLAPSHFNELPSPSSASLHSGHESLGIQELTTKSNSAPLLLKQEKKRDDFAGQKLTLRYSRSQSDRYLAEIEAVEACKWLRAAGFPQYAQMYEDHQFPLDLTNVAKDHTNLENDQLQSLYRRLCILNRCANMRLDQSHKTQTPQKEDSDDENFALSENWTFQPHIRRWSRIGEMGLELPPSGKLNAEKTESSSKESSPDRFEDDSYDITGAGLSLTLPGAGDSTDTTLNDSTEPAGVRLRRTGSERLKDGAKAFLRRVESIKSRRRKRQNRDGVVISGPQALDLSQLGQRSSLRKPDAVYSTPPSPSAMSPVHSFPKTPFFGNELKVPSQSDNFLSPHRASPKRTPTTPRSMRTSPLHFFSTPMPHLKEGKSDDSSSYYSDSQESSAGGKLVIRKTPSKTRRFLQRTGKVDDIGAHSDSECHQGRKLLIKDANSNTTEIKTKKLARGGSLNLGKDPKKREGLRSASFRSRSTTRKETKTEENDGVKRTPVMRWHSFQMDERPQMIFRKCFAQKIDQNSNDQGIPFAAMSAGQLQIIRKLALVILTGHMERYCPTHRSGWNWELPKFIKKIKMPDYKDKKVFGVPLLLILQRTGQTLPIAVRAALRWLQLNALDQIGLFRKSGVKSRIIKLKELIEYSESTAECMDVFDTQQAYDVADMLKQYFRDLPESLLTTKMSETFAAIFQHLPPEVRLDAVQCAVLLLPDENREILYALLEFLTLVAANSQYNQMTANNLAVCLAPSLFHSSISTGTNSVSASPRRRGKGSGVPDPKELSEAKASHECLAFMIDNYRQIYTASKERIGRCNFGYMEESKPVPLEALGEGMQFHNWRGYLYECTSATIKEGREKTRGWFSVASIIDSSVDIAYKKVGDGHPLRLWRCVTEVEGPPKEVLDYVIKQRASWDVNLLQCQTVKKLDERTEIYQFALDGQVTTDFCVLRSWQTDLPRGACVIVETSIDHAKAKPLFGAVRGVVLASRYLIEPCGSGRSRVMHLARVDIKGKTPEWYNKSYGHICSHFLSRIRLAFKHVAEGPESKV